MFWEKVQRQIGRTGSEGAGRRRAEALEVRAAPAERRPALILQQLAPLVFVRAVVPGSAGRFLVA